MTIVGRVFQSKQTAAMSRTANCRSSRIRLVVALLAVVGVFIWAGSDRVPADPTKPLVVTGGVQDESVAGPSIRVATFNIHGGKGNDGKLNLDRTAACLQNLDLVGLNEVHGDCLGLRTNQAAELAQTLGMGWLFAATEKRWWHDHFGNALLTRVVLTGVHRIPLPGTQTKKFRNAVLANFRHAGKTVQLLLVHVDRSRDREAQLKAVCNLFLSLQEPAILMGDLNTPASDPQLRRLLSTPGVNDAVAEARHDNAPKNRIDWIITRGFRTLDADCRSTIASDHPVVWAELELVIPAKPDVSVKNHVGRSWR